MAKRSIQGYVELASGLSEMTASRAKEAAQELVALSGLDESSKKVGRQTAKIAEELMEAAATNRENLRALVQREVDNALERVEPARLFADVQSLATSVQDLAGQVEDLAGSVTGRAKERADEGGSTSPGATSPAPAPQPPAAEALATEASATPQAGTVKKAPAKRAAKKAPARKAPAKKTTAKKTTAKKTTAKKTTAKKTNTASGTGGS